MSEHTPGPWQYHLGRGAAQRFHVQTTAGYQVASTPEVNKYETREADARLLSAAPDMLEALQELFEHCAMVHARWGDGCNQREADAAIAKGRAAIAKAEGRN